MRRYPGQVTPQTWAVHADAGRTTWSAGIPGGRQAAFLDKGAAEAFAGENNVALFRWDGRTGHQAEIPEHELEAEIG